MKISLPRGVFAYLWKDSKEGVKLTSHGGEFNSLRDATEKGLSHVITEYN